MPMPEAKECGVGQGVYGIEVYDDQGRFVCRFASENQVTDEGWNNVLAQAFNKVSQVDYYVALITGSPDPTLAITDTYASKGFTEFTNYSSATRPVWTPSAAANREVATSSTIDIVMSGSGTIHGISMVTNSAKGDSAAGAGKFLLSQAPFPANVPVLTGYTLKASYDFSIANAP